MALPAHLAERFSPALNRALRIGSAPKPESQKGFSLGPLDAVLPDGGFVRGGIVELCVGEGVPKTSLVLEACRSVQLHSERAGSSPPWCAFVDPSATLHGPGVAELGVRLDRLLVVRPTLEALPRTVMRLAKAAAFELVFVDLTGALGATLRVPLAPWARVVRRLALEIDGSARSVVLITEKAAQRPLTLPVAQRIEVDRPALDRLVVRVAKDRRGLLVPPRPVVWARSLHEPSEEAPHARVG